MPPRSLCARCGGSEHVEIGGNTRRCVDCGHESRFTTMRAVASRPAQPTDPGVSRHLAMNAQMEPRFSEAEFSPFALDSRWTGLRSFGGFGGGNGRTDRLSLAHGEPFDPEAAQVRVETKRPQQIGINGPRDPTSTRFFAVQELVRHFFNATGSLPDAARAAAFPYRDPDAFGKDPTAPWADATLPVDEIPVAFKVLSGGDAWVALGQLDGLFLAITSHQWPVADTGLVAVTDFGVYAAGSAEIHERMLLRHEDEE